MTEDITGNGFTARIFRQLGETEEELESTLAGESAALEEVATHKHKLARIASILDRLSADLPRTNAATWEAIIKIHAVIEETSDAG